MTKGTRVVDDLQLRFFTSELVIVTMIILRQYSKILMLREPLHSFQLPFVVGVSRLDYVIISFFD
jgi:hypothetical protein